MHKRERERWLPWVLLVSNSNCLRRAKKQTKFTAVQIFLCSLQHLRNTIMAIKYGSLNTSLL